ncbi:MAG: tandem-95 repeat protein [Gammaproteobacteria bacterium]|nr:tandem-95 repeat protein [Gammaproteobacteria bacterium]
MQPRFLSHRRFSVLLAVPMAMGLFPLPAAPQEITYRVRFEGNWTLASTPGGVAPGGHFTTLIGGVHGSGVTFWRAGERASPGVEGVAEEGFTGTFRSEVAASPHTRSVIQEGVAGGGTGRATFNIDVTRTHPRVTLLSMIGPSPDWFVGVSGVSLLDGADEWRESHVVDLFPYDAGTEEGDDFSLSNPDTSPQGVITRIAATGPFSNVRMARLTFTRLTTPPPRPNNPPTVQAACEPCTVPRGGEVRLRADASDPDGDAIVYDWSAGQGTFTGATDGPVARWTAPDRLGRVVIRVAVRDGRGGTAAAEVAVEVVNRPPMFAGPLRFEIAENRDARGTPVTLGQVRVTDPDGDDVELGLVSGSDRFVIDAASGALRYVGPGEDFEAGPNRYALTVTATDAPGGEARAEVEVQVVDVNEHPAATDDALSVAEDRRTRVDVLANDDDPDRGDRIRVVSVGAPEHGQAQVVGAGAAVQYAPDPNYHGPDRFTYVVADAGGLADTATVQVTVTPVNDAPGAADDQATTREDEAIEIPVLDNDADLDGDRLRVRSVSPAGHGTAAVAADRTHVTYVPNPNYHGPDRFTYVVADAGGLADTATVEVTVVPVNDGPAAVGKIPDQLLDEGAAGVTVDLTPFFTDLDGDPLAFTAETSNAHVVTAAVNGAALALLPVTYGDATVTVTATDPGGLAAAQRVTVGVSDRSGRAVLSDAFAAVARSYLSSARMTLERRVAPGARTGGTDAGQQSGLRVGGRSVALPDGHTFWDAAKQVVAGWLPDPEAMSNRFAHETPAGVLSSLHQIRAPAGISATDFTLAWGGQSADSARAGIAWSLWGQTDVQRYEGGAAELGSGLARISGDYDGDLRVRYLGLDAQLPSWLFGVALGRSKGAGDWNAGTASGRLSTSMTSVHPYLRWSRGATAIWTTFGAGRGDARNERAETGRVGESPLDLAMGLFEFQRRLGPSGGPIAFGLRADAGWASLSTGEGTETIDDLRGRVHQARLGLDVRSEMRVGGAGVAPSGAVHVRHDGGDGQTGRGVEVSGGLRTQIGVVGLDLLGRWLAFHSATRYGESGAGLTLTVGGRGEEGFSLSASPRWGGQTRGGFALWQDRAPGMTPGPDLHPTGWTMDVRGAYRARLSGRQVEVATVYDRASGGQRLQLSGHVGLALADRR